MAPWIWGTQLGLMSSWGVCGRAKAVSSCGTEKEGRKKEGGRERGRAGGKERERGRERGFQRIFKNASPMI